MIADMQSVIICAFKSVIICVILYFEDDMCLAIPMKVVKIDGDSAVVEAGGLRRAANILFLRDVKKGDYVLIHAGFAIEKVNTKEARETLRLISRSLTSYGS